MKHPSSRTCTMHAKYLGESAFREYVRLRDGYKRKGLTPQEAKDRAYVELKVGERYLDLKRRRAMGKMLESQVPLTGEEINKVVPDYIKDPSATSSESIGDREMSHLEQVQWAKRMVARVQDGQEAPKDFPCDGALFWYQTAVGNREKFLTILQNAERASSGEVDSIYIQDSQYQYSEIEKQVKEALVEAGAKLREFEKGLDKVLEGV